MLISRMNFKIIKRIKIFQSKILTRLNRAICNITGSKVTLWDNSAVNYAIDDFKVYWETLDAVREYQNECVSDDKHIGMLAFSLDYIEKHLGKSGLKGLSIGCVHGKTPPELHFMRSGFFESFDVMDIAKSLLKNQEKNARDSGFENINYHVRDFNNIELKQDQYDVVWGIGTIHHIGQLEPFFRQVKHSLKKNGLFIIREYIGPNRLQFTEKQLDLSNKILKRIPFKYRLKWHGFPKIKIKAINENKLIKADPSEAICSQDILPSLKKSFNVSYFRGTGGTILHPLLNEIAGNFEFDDKGRQLLNEIIDEEKMYIENDEIGHDYMYCICEK